uniref:P9 n=1 Tax=croton golden spot associated virus C TaxID=3072822 RepID=A0AA50E3Y3_9CLOS|nr:p9 [croton golden spot associated virus C]
MDLTGLIEKYGEDKVEKYYSIFIKSKYSAGGTALCILRLINERFLHFTDDNKSSTFDNLNLEEFLECLYWFTLLPKFFN